MKTILRNQRGNYAGAMEDEEGRDAVLCRKKSQSKMIKRRCANKLSLLTTGYCLLKLFLEVWIPLLHDSEGYACERSVELNNRVWGSDRVVGPC